MIPNALSGALAGTPLAHQEIDGWRGQAAVFEDIFLVFMVLGTLVGVVVVAYMLLNAYKYREGASEADGFDAPTVGELPTGGTGGKKLFLSFAISAIIVIGLVAWTYTALLYVEGGAQEDIETEHNIDIQAQQFSWSATYPSGETATTFESDSDSNYIAIPSDTMVGLHVTSTDVWHTFGVTDLRIKIDAIPGQEADSWLLVEEEGTYNIECFELCGAGHSAMDGTLKVIDADEWEEQYGEDAAEENDD